MQPEFIKRNLGSSLLTWSNQSMNLTMWMDVYESNMVETTWLPVNDVNH